MTEDARLRLQEGSHVGSSSKTPPTKPAQPGAHTAWMCEFSQWLASKITGSDPVPGENSDSEDIGWAAEVSY